MQASHCRASFLTVSLALLSGGALAAEDQPPNDTELVWEFDAYYTSVGAHFPLTDAPVPDGGQMTEREVYRQLFLDSFKPRLLLLEASVYPLPALGTWIRSQEPGLYNSAEIGNTGFNLIESVTAGFQEPWALSAFIGSEMEFTRPGKKRRGTNRGYMGYLFSYGGKHIKDNQIIDDDWFEFEWKLKGEREFEDDILTFSYSVGAKLHENPGIADIVYLSFRRSSIDFDGPLLSWLSNSNMTVKTEFTQHGMSFARQELTFGKNFPIKKWGVTLGVDFGAIYEKDRKYLGALLTPTEDNFTIVFRPNIIF